jgi:hypothetical protein
MNAGPSCDSRCQTRFEWRSGILHEKKNFARARSKPSHSLPGYSNQLSWHHPEGTTGQTLYVDKRVLPNSYASKMLARNIVSYTLERIVDNTAYH